MESNSWNYFAFDQPHEKKKSRQMEEPHHISISNSLALRQKLEKNFHAPCVCKRVSTHEGTNEWMCTLILS